MIAGLNEPSGLEDQDRIRCPFYGFTWPQRTHRLVQVEGNQCGLALDRVEPCCMEAEGRAIDIEHCPAASRASDLVKMARPVIVFITPQNPAGIPYAQWDRCRSRGA